MRTAIHAEPVTTNLSPPAQTKSQCMHHVGVQKVKLESLSPGLGVHNCCGQVGHVGLIGRSRKREPSPTLLLQSRDCRRYTHGFRDRACTTPAGHGPLSFLQISSSPANMTQVSRKESPRGGLPRVLQSGEQGRPSAVEDGRQRHSSLQIQQLHC